MKIPPRHAEDNSFDWIRLVEDRKPVTSVCEQGNELYEFLGKLRNFSKERIHSVELHSC